MSEKPPTFRRSAVFDGDLHLDANGIRDRALRDAVMRAMARMEATGYREIILRVKEDK
jgi:hypothetical protein